MVCHCHHTGVGNVVLQVAATVNCKECIGIEKAEIPSSYAQVRTANYYKIYYIVDCQTITAYFSYLF